jgi:hypothetical protein
MNTWLSIEEDARAIDLPVSHVGMRKTLAQGIMASSL